MLTACVGAGLATLLAYVTNRKLVLGHQVLGFLAVAPVVIPGVVLAVALFVAYTRPPFLLYGTLWILFIAYLTKEMPVGYSQADATMRGIHPELEEAGRILGAGRLRVLREITAPLARSGIIATWCFVFIGVIRELSASIILFTPEYEGHVGGDLRPEGRRPVRRHRGAGHLHARDDLRHRGGDAGPARPRRHGRAVLERIGLSPCPASIITGLTKRYGDVAAVAGLDLTVRPGELVALLGPSGCGKTTTLRLVAGFMAPDAGEIRVGDRVLSVTGHRDPARAAAHGDDLPELRALAAHDGGAERGLRAALRERRRAPSADGKVDEILRAVQLAGYGARYPGELSGGQQQRVAVARALVVEPEILLLDEPLSNLDASLREEMRFEIRRLHERFGITTLYVTHDQAEAMVISDRAAVIRNGRVEQIGAPHELFERPRTRFVAEFIGKTNLIDAVADGAATVARGRLRLRVAADGLTPGTPAVVSIRPHLIALGPRTDPGTPAPARTRSRAPCCGRATSATRWTTRSRWRAATSSCGSPAPPPRAPDRATRCR